MSNVEYNGSVQKFDSTQEGLSAAEFLTECEKMRVNQDLKGRMVNICLGLAVQIDAGEISISEARQQRAMIANAGGGLIYSIFKLAMDIFN